MSIRLDLYWIDWVPTHVRYIKGMQQGGLSGRNGDISLLVCIKRFHKMLSSTQHVGVIGWFFDMWQLSMSMRTFPKDKTALLFESNRIRECNVSMPSSTCYSWLQSSMGGILMRKKSVFGSLMFKSDDHSSMLVVSSACWTALTSFGWWAMRWIKGNIQYTSAVDFHWLYCISISRVLFQKEKECHEDLRVPLHRFETSSLYWFSIILHVS
jgi:hypothetical protein